ncbi:MAG: hypothetical protein EVG15_10285 [Candidatus Acididesulfobacter diazotrophicus]|jgi:hypothetical protein|uniref:DUF6311 domain-containing protein n=1 Tax=Candidatus Acididesulfobacter diazotrophicus TaxID=2597226 RepID=A0A519BK24_9DELT|nr:MAG: hypothetical protein EVG15_10285 [Candidatus Acididesulfobacter diazotrophicus]
MKKNYYTLSLFFILALFFWGLPMEFDFTNRLNISGDPAFFLWSLKWWPYAISHGLNPFLTKTFYSPFGQNLAWTTSIPSIALVMWPITDFFGVVFSYNLTTVLSLTLAPFGIYLINKQLGLKESSSIFGGIIFFFSSYIWGQLHGHLNLDIIFVIVFLCYLYILKFKGLISSRKYIILFAVLLAFQFGISNEIYATFVVFSFIALIILIIFYFKEKIITKKLTALGFNTMLGIAVSVILLLPYIYYMLSRHIPGSFNNNAFYVADPINYIVPTPITYFFGNLFLPISSKFAGNFSEEGAYLGLPLIFILISFLYLTFKNLKKQSKLYVFIALFLIICILFSFGPYLRILNHKIIPMPWIIFAHLPFIKQALPTRFTFYVDITTSIIAAIWFDKNNNKKLKYIIGGFTILFLLPNLNNYKGQNIKYPDFITSAVYKKYLTKGKNILVLPTYSQGGFSGPLWQQKTDFYFNLSEKIAGLPPKKFIQDGIEPIITIYNKKNKLSFFKYILKCKVKDIIISDKYNKFNKLIKGLFIKPIKIKGIKIYQINANTVRKDYADQNRKTSANSN